MTSAFTARTSVTQMPTVSTSMGATHAPARRVTSGTDSVVSVSIHVYQMMCRCVDVSLNQLFDVEIALNHFCDVDISLENVCDVDPDNNHLHKIYPRTIVVMQLFLLNISVM